MVYICYLNISVFNPVLYTISDKKKDLNRMKNLLDILADPSKRLPFINKLVKIICFFIISI